MNTPAKLLARDTHFSRLDLGVSVPGIALPTICQHVQDQLRCRPVQGVALEAKGPHAIPLFENRRGPLFVLEGRPGNLSDILFQSISIAAPSILGEPQLLLGQSDACIRNLIFENLTVGGEPVRDPEFFKTNEFVDGLKFAPSTLSKP